MTSLRPFIVGLCRGAPASSGNLVRRAVADPRFPLKFLVRNLLLLEEETAWRSLPVRLKKREAARIARERAEFFIEVRGKRHRLLGEGAAGKIAEGPGLGTEAPEEDSGGYCHHCGGCCEIAGGLPDFPAGAPLPPRWKRLFHEGLGRFHRFCPFLWQYDARGASLCSIHPWRPRPCRLFEKDECLALGRDSAFRALGERLAASRDFHFWLCPEGHGRSRE